MTDPHQNQPVLTAGAPLEKARFATILLHGRGANPHDILALANEIYHPDFIYMAPQAEGYTWYPYSFLEPLARNEPKLSSALALLGSLVARVSEAGIDHDRVMIGGFSQGACLALEFVARNARRYAGVFGFSGGLIGPEETPREYEGTLDGTPVFLGCSDVDPHIPKARVEHTAGLLRELGAVVTMRLYPGMGHTVNQDELTFVREMINDLE